MLGWIFFFIVLFIAYKTNPDASSFHAYFTSDTKPKDGVSGFLTNLLSSKPRVPVFKHNDYFCFSIVTLQNGTAAYLGLFSFWFLLSQVVIVEDGKKKPFGNWFIGGQGSKSQQLKLEEATELQVLEDRANVDRETAIKAKVKRDYDTAAKHFLLAAKRFQNAGGDNNQLDAAACYEDAYKAFQQTKKTGKALEALEIAATIYELRNQQATRAARVYEQLAVLYKKTNSEHRDLEKALAMHQKAADLFEEEGDGRHLYSLISQAELTAEIGHYEKAIRLLDTIAETAADDRVQSFKIKDYVFLQCICLIALDDWVRLERRFEELNQLYPSFADSRESTLIRKLVEAKNTYDLSAFVTSCRDYDQFTPLPPWQIEVLLKLALRSNFKSNIF
ncbi:hypothetical protein G9A89_009293 [Geosiphon pyriformis]|nr:hypothetical protein G9A89_009293 [Geosiphon pyriformis]